MFVCDKKKQQEIRIIKLYITHRRSKRYGRSGFGRTTFWPMTTPTITSTLCACSEFFNRGHQVTSESCRCFVGEMDCAIPSQPHPPASSPNDHLGRNTCSSQFSACLIGLSSGLSFTMMKLKILYIATLAFSASRRSD